MPKRSVGVYPDENGEILVGFESGQKGLPLKSLIPEAVRGEKFGVFDVRGYFSLAQIILVTPEDLQVFTQALNFKGASKSKSRKGTLPPINPAGLALCQPNGDLDPERTAELFKVVTAYWEHKDEMAIELGYVAAMWKRANSAEVVITFIKDNTRKHPKTGELELVSPKSTLDEKLFGALMPTDIPISKITKAKLETLVEWMSAVPRGHASYENPKSKAADLVFLGVVDASGKVVKSATDAARDYIWGRLDQPPNFPALWRHIQASRGRLPAEDSQADYSAYNFHLAELFDEGIGNLALVEAVLALAKTNVAVPTERLYRAARVIWELDQAKDNRRAMEEELKQQALDLGGWLFLDTAINFTREAQKIVASGAPKLELEAYIETAISKAGSPATIRQYKAIYQRPGFAKRLQDLRVVDKTGDWSEVGFLRQQIMIAEAKLQGIPPSLEWLRWALHCRYHAKEPVPLVWALQDDKLPAKSVQRARLLASMALSGGMTGKKFQIDEVITPEQFQLLWKFGAWLSDDVAVYLNYEYPDLSWLAKYTQHPRLRLEDWQEICDFIYGKFDQDPVPSLLHDRLKKMGIIVSDWREDEHRTSPSKPFNHAEKVGRNDPCPCGSGKKYKKCCGR